MGQLRAQVHGRVAGVTDFQANEIFQAPILQLGLLRAETKRFHWHGL